MCWGYDFYAKPTPPAGIAFESISAGKDHACGIRSSDNEVQCWGSNEYGQSTPPAGIAFKSISAGDWNTCGLLPTGIEVCWGNIARNLYQ
jgi:hypothetical protein